MPEVPSPTPGPAPGDAPVATDIAAPERIRATRRQVIAIESELGLQELGEEERRGAPRTLSAAELRLGRAVARFLGRGERQVPEVDGPRFISLLDTDVSLTQLGRAAGELEATAAIGEIFLKARLTWLNDQVFLHAGAQDTPQKDRDALRVALASADLIYEREQQLLKTRRERAALRRERYQAALAASQGETERLRRSGKLLEGIDQAERKP